MTLVSLGILYSLGLLTDLVDVKVTQLSSKRELEQHGVESKNRGEITV